MLSLIISETKDISNVKMIAIQPNLTNQTNNSDQIQHQDNNNNNSVPNLPSTIELAAEDIRQVLDQQREQSKTLTTKLNILFVVNGALLTSLTLSKLMYTPSVFSCCEILGFLVNFSLLINAFLPRQIAVSPNLEDNTFLERYLALTPKEYHLQMMVNLVKTYNANKQRIDDVSQSLTYAAYVTWAIALVIMLHTVVAFFTPLVESPYF